MTEVLRAALDHRALTLLLIGLAAGGLALLDSRRARHRERVAQVLLRWYLVFPIGVGFLLAAVEHGHGFPGTWSGAGGPAASPDAFQLGAASLGFAVVGFLAAGGGLGMRFAALVGPAIAVYGPAAGRAAGLSIAPAAPADALLVPLVGFALLAWQYRAQSRRSVFARSRL